MWGGSGAHPKILVHMLSASDGIMGRLVTICNNHVLLNAGELIWALLGKKRMMGSFCFITKNLIDFGSSIRK